MTKEILPKVDLKYDDIRDTLNANDGYVTNFVLTAFKKEANIKPWAKYKPVIYKEPFPKFESNWWKSTDGGCGILLKPTKDLDALVNLFETGDTGWTHIPPVGNENSPYRLGDFRNYYVKANSPIKYYFDKNVVTRMGSAYYAVITTFYDQLRKKEELEFSDINTKRPGFNYNTGEIRDNLGQWYAGFIYKKQKLNGYKIVTYDKTLALATTDAPTSIKVLVYPNEAGEMVLFPVLCSSPITEPSNNTSGVVMLPMPDAKKEIINVVFDEGFHWDIVNNTTTCLKNDTIFKINVSIHYVSKFNEANKRYVSGKWYYAGWYNSHTTEFKEFPYSPTGYDFSMTGDEGVTEENFYVSPEITLNNHVNELTGDIERVERLLIEFKPDNGLDPGVSATFFLDASKTKETVTANKSII